MNTKFKNLKVLTLTGLMSLMSIAAFSNDGVRATVKDIKEATETFSEETLPSQTAQLISGKKDAIKKVETQFKYSPTSIYEIFVSPDYSTRIEINSDENVSYIGGGDSANWQIDMSRGGEKNATSVYVKPLEDDLRTNLIIQTDKRTYTFFINGDEDYFNVLVKFSYPLDARLSVYKSNDLTDTLSGTSVKTAADNIRNLTTSYKITPTNLEFSPVGVYNDGQKTYIKFKDNLQESPVLVVKGVDGKLEEVNYHQENNVIRVDKVIKAGQLKLGKKTVKFQLY